MPKISSQKDKISLEIEKFNEKVVKTKRFDLKIRNPYMIKKMQLMFLTEI